MSYPYMESYNKRSDGKIDYEKVYHSDDMKNSDLHPWWQNKLLKWCDSFPALCYAHGITDVFLENKEISETVSKEFPNVPHMSFYSAKICNSGYTVHDQIDFLLKHKTREPKKIIEIGGGNGSVSCTLSHMGYDVQCVETMIGADNFFMETNNHFFNKNIANYRLINKPLHKSLDDLDWSGVDTVIMVESIEHILKEDFDQFYQTVLEKLNGYFIVNNIITMHPINVGSGHIPEEHCRKIDDELYTQMEKDFSGTILRNGSHLVLNNVNLP